MRGTFYGGDRRSRHAGVRQGTSTPARAKYCAPTLRRVSAKDRSPTEVHALAFEKIRCSYDCLHDGQFAGNSLEGVAAAVMRGCPIPLVEQVASRSEGWR